MKKTLHIARNELYTLFYSPIAWFLMIVFFIMTSANYISVLERLQTSYFSGGQALMLVKELTSLIISGDPRFSYFFRVISDLYMFFPLITMGLLSRETSSGTIKLLYSSPVRVRQIVLGKYLAMLCFTLCLLALCALTTIALSMSITSPDYGIIISSLLGLFLVLATYAAIGLFISALTSYQIVAAIITLAVFGLISQVGSLLQDIDVVRNITYYLNLPGKSYNVIRGLMNLRDVTYFLIISGSFLVFTAIKLKSATESLNRSKKIARYALVIIIAALVAYITEKPSVNVYADMTRNNLHTITQPSQKTIAKLDDGPLEITVFANLLEHYYFYFKPEVQNAVITQHLERYIRFKPDTKVKFVYYYGADTSSYLYKTNPGKTLKQIAEKQATANRTNLKRFLTPEEAKKLVNIEVEEFRHFFLLKYKGKQVVVRTFNDLQFWPNEDQFAASFNRLISASPKIIFLTDEIERGPFSAKVRDYKKATSSVSYRHSLVNKGFDFDTLSLRNSDIPKNVAAVVMADPRIAVSPVGLQKISDYIDKGGNMLIAAEPDRREIIQPILDKLGITVRNGMLIQPSAEYSSDAVFGSITQTAINLSPQFARYLAEQRLYYGDSVFRVLMPGAGALNYIPKDGFEIEPLALTDSSASWNRTSFISNDSLQLKIPKQAGDEQRTFATVLKLKRSINNKEQRVIVSGDADFLIDALPFGKIMNYGSIFGSWCFSYFAYNHFPANTLRPEGKDNAFIVAPDNISTQKMILYWIIPAIIGVMGSILLIRRKRK